MTREDQKRIDAMRRHPAGRNLDPVDTAQQAHDDLDIQPLYGTSTLIDKLIWGGAVIVTAVLFALIILGVGW